MPTATEYAADLVASVRDDPAGRVALMRSLYEAEPGRPELHLPSRRAALGFMGWQLRRGLLNALDGEVLGSPWWRAVNQRLLRDTAEARAHVLGLSGPMSSWSATCCAEFAQQPSARLWYRAQNASIVCAYLDHRELAESETYPERFFVNLILVRVLFAHALVAAPRRHCCIEPSRNTRAARSSLEFRQTGADRAHRGALAAKRVDLGPDARVAQEDLPSREPLNAQCNSAPPGPGRTGRIAGTSAPRARSPQAGTGTPRTPTTLSQAASDGDCASSSHPHCGRGGAAVEQTRRH
jgi:hypothetical protein